MTKPNAPSTALACGRGGLRETRVALVPGIRVWLRGCVALPFDYGLRDGRTEESRACAWDRGRLHCMRFSQVSVLDNVLHSPARLSLGRGALVQATMHGPHCHTLIHIAPSVHRPTTRPSGPSRLPTRLGQVYLLYGVLRESRTARRARSATSWTARWARCGMGEPAIPTVCESWCAAKAVEDKSWPWMCKHFVRCMGCAQCHIAPRVSELDHEGLPVRARSLQLPEHLDGDRYANMDLKWNDEFDECPDGRPDPVRWRYEGGFLRNNELQYYRKEDAACSDGTLTITARYHAPAVAHPLQAVAEASPRCHGPLLEQPEWCQDAREGLHYTSSSLESNQDTTGLLLRGQYDARIRIPLAANAWPAFWAVGSSSGRSGMWPQDGEIDIMECARSLCSPTRDAHSAPFVVPNHCALYPPRRRPRRQSLYGLGLWPHA